MSPMVKKENKMKNDPSSPARNKKYKGVRMRSWGSWVSEIRAPSQKTRIWLGSYSNAEAAARAYDAALLCLKGSSANLNFPMSDSHYYIPQDTVLSPKAIQRVAAAAAANSPASSSSSSHQIDEGAASFMSYFETQTTPCDETNSLAMMELSWYSFEALQSPKYMDQMLQGTLFDTPVVLDESYEESDLPLWNIF